MASLFGLSILSVVRQRTALVAFIAIPAILVLLAADALSQFANVLAVGGADIHIHSGHFDVLATLWAAGMSAAVVAAITVAESKSADTILALAGGSWRWASARCLSFVMVAAIATAFALFLSAAQGNSVTLQLAVGMFLVGILYALVGQIVAYFSPDAVSAVGYISAVWILDALCAPTMTDDGVFRRLISPFYTAENLAMGGDMGVGDWMIMSGWVLVLLALFCLCYRLRPTFPTLGRTRRDPRATATATDRHAPSVVGASPHIEPRTGGWNLMLTDLWRHRGLILFVTLGPLTLMLSSLWLFEGVDVAVPSMVDGARSVVGSRMPELHAAYMGMIAVVSFCGTAGYLIGSELLAADRRLARSSHKPLRVVRLRMLSLLAIAPVATLFALLLISLVRQPDNWLWFVAAHIGAGWSFTFVGFCLGLVLDRVAGILVMMFFPFIDVGIAQDYMLGPVLPGWSVYLPSHPFVQICISAAFGGEVFDARYALWSAGIIIAAMLSGMAIMSRGVRFAGASATSSGKVITEQLID